MLKIAIVCFVLLIPAIAFAQETTPETGKLSSFVTFWRNLAQKAEQQNQEFKLEIDDNSQRIIEKQFKVRTLLNNATRALQNDNMPRFIALMNQAEIQLNTLNDTGLSTNKEQQVYDNLLKAGVYRNISLVKTNVQTN
jgi:esterase/lipase